MKYLEKSVKASVQIAAPFHASPPAESHWSRENVATNRTACPPRVASMPYDNKWHRAVIACTSQLSLGGRGSPSRIRVSISIEKEGPHACFFFSSTSSSNFCELPRKCKSKTKKRWRGERKRAEGEARRGEEKNELYEYEIRGGGGGGSCQSRIFSRW